jgi:hypothetical protein
MFIMSDLHLPFFKIAPLRSVGAKKSPKLGYDTRLIAVRDQFTRRLLCSIAGSAGALERTPCRNRDLPKMIGVVC